MLIAAEDRLKIDPSKPRAARPLGIKKKSLATHLTDLEVRGVRTRLKGNQHTHCGLTA